MRVVKHISVNNDKKLQQLLESSEWRVKLHFLPQYAQHLNPIERFWGVMHKRVTHNHHYVTFKQSTEAVLGLFRKTLPD
jgi:transposase